MNNQIVRVGQTGQINSSTDIVTVDSFVGLNNSLRIQWNGFSAEANGIVAVGALAAILLAVVLSKRRARWRG